MTKTKKPPKPKPPRAPNTTMYVSADFGRREAVMVAPRFQVPFSDIFEGKGPISWQDVVRNLSKAINSSCTISDAKFELEYGMDGPDDLVIITPRSETDEEFSIRMAWIDYEEARSRETTARVEASEYSEYVRLRKKFEGKKP